MVFVDTWAWLALALKRDQYHKSAIDQHRKFTTEGRQYVTTDYVLSELITQLYRSLTNEEAGQFTRAVLTATDSGTYRLERISPQRFSDAWLLRLRYDDKPSISFVDLTSFVVMQELGLSDVFTGDHHFEQVNLGFRLLP